MAQAQHAAAVAAQQQASQQQLAAMQQQHTGWFSFELFIILFRFTSHFL